MDREKFCSTSAGLAGVSNLAGAIFSFYDIFSRGPRQWLSFHDVTTPVNASSYVDGARFYVQHYTRIQWAVTFNIGRMRIFARSNLPLADKTVVNRTRSTEYDSEDSKSRANPPHYRQCRAALTLSELPSNPSLSEGIDIMYLSSRAASVSRFTLLAACCLWSLPCFQLRSGPLPPQTP